MFYVNFLVHIFKFSVFFFFFPSFPQPSINTTNIDTLLVATDQTERIVEPPENVQEKIAFIFNNLSQSNMTQKVSFSVHGILHYSTHVFLQLHQN